MTILCGKQGSFLTFPASLPKSIYSSPLTTITTITISYQDFQQLPKATEQRTVKMDPIIASTSKAPPPTAAHYLKTVPEGPPCPPYLVYLPGAHSAPVSNVFPRCSLKQTFPCRGLCPASLSASILPQSLRQLAIFQYSDVSSQDTS